ncbi:AAA family ATPase [Candidatus Proelusimicrobium excrementi]|uniref:AAA family ATPase n=1 Tax=Candidatus Proelusimicrobium excrementi TaxID=3416222 RepID=UPI003CBC1425|nr:AAA family ATPase [Elusimicrobiaceae bacterium]
MKYTYEEYETFYYLNKLAPCLRAQGDFTDNMYWLNRDLSKKKRLVPLTQVKNNRDDYREKMAEKVAEALEKQAPHYLNEPPSVLRQNIHLLSELFHLSEAEEKILMFLVVARKNRPLRRTLQRFQHDFEGNKDMLEAVSDMPEGTILSILKSTAPLRHLGLLCPSGYSRELRLAGWVDEFASGVYADTKACYEAILGSPIVISDALHVKDFTYVEAANLALRLMKQAKHTKGFNILLYGMPGTGKTSFAKVLAKTAKLKLYPVGVCNDGEAEKNYRLQQYYRKQFLLREIKNTCVLFDEGEDMFSSLETRTNKIEINNLLENNEVPVIWTTNKIHHMDPAYIRRFTLAVCFNKPPVEVRQKIWNKYLNENKITCDKGDTLTLAKKYEVPPSMIAGAAQVARMAKGDFNTVKEHLSYMIQALRGGYKKPEDSTNKQEFETALINADMNLDLLTQRIKHLGRLNFSLCLYGASGTGKSAYARYLAQELGLDVLHRRASDLIGSFVGETEHNIAKSFADAKENKSLLIFDEADSFLRDRSMAMRSWEVTAVNEMLTWMESHSYPFICTTNLMDTLDPASLRRFSFKVKYDFLTPQQVVCAFMFFFRVMIDKKDVEGLNKLTPGDFSLVKNKAEILGHPHDFYALREMLEAEQKLKHNAYGSGIGFHVN